MTPVRSCRARSPSSRLAPSTTPPWRLPRPAASLADVVQWSVLIAADGDLGAAYGATPRSLLGTAPRRSSPWRAFCWTRRAPEPSSKRRRDRRGDAHLTRSIPILGGRLSAEPVVIDVVRRDRHGDPVSRCSLELDRSRRRSAATTRPPHGGELRIRGDREIAADLERAERVAGIDDEQGHLRMANGVLDLLAVGGQRRDDPIPVVGGTRSWSIRGVPIRAEGAERMRRPVCREGRGGCRGERSSGHSRYLASATSPWNPRRPRSAIERVRPERSDYPPPRWATVCGTRCARSGPTRSSPETSSRWGSPCSRTCSTGAVVPWVEAAFGAVAARLLRTEPGYRRPRVDARRESRLGEPAASSGRRPRPGRRADRDHRRHRRARPTPAPHAIPPAGHHVGPG